MCQTQNIDSWQSLNTAAQTDIAHPRKPFIQDTGLPIAVDIHSLVSLKAFEITLYIKSEKNSYSRPSKEISTK